MELELDGHWVQPADAPSPPGGRDAAALAAGVTWIADGGQVSGGA